MRTSNGGTGWQFFSTGGVKALDLAAPAENTVLLIGPKGVRRSTDGGDTISRIRNRALMATKLSRVDRAGSAGVLATAGKEVHLPSGTVLTLTRDSPVEIRVPLEKR